MRLRHALTRATGVTAAVALGAVMAASPALAGSSTGSSSSTPTAGSESAAAGQVSTLLARVRVLQKQAAAAEARYQQAFSSVARGVSESVSSAEAEQSAQATLATAQQRMQRQVMAVYESGGTLAAYASVMSGDLAGVAQRAAMASRAVSAQSDSLSAAGQIASSADVAAASAAQVASHRIATARDIATAADQVTALLGQEKSLLAKANQHLSSVRAAIASLAAANSQFGSITTSAVDNIGVLPPSAQYLALYQGAAATCPSLSWTVLAAVGQVESGHGRDTSVSSAGAMGPMQFLPSTFNAYAVDADPSAPLSIEDPADAIYTAAHYLCANGAGRSPGATANAIFDYNHAVWYVQMVLNLAAKYASQYA